ncbi:MAG: hypothetical protein L6R37_001468 [Teloschistes peruensis]|nr:MAG: hypothetical protein L6R37_001468 [Teloschistes peruensis]
MFLACATPGGSFPEPPLLDDEVAESRDAKRELNLLLIDFTGFQCVKSGFISTRHAQMIPRLDSTTIYRMGKKGAETDNADDANEKSKPEDKGEDAFVAEGNLQAPDDGHRKDEDDDVSPKTVSTSEGRLAESREQ